jgi:hypothetical protein
MLSHLPIQLSTVASGAGIVSLLEHAHDAATPVGTGCLLGGSVAIGLPALILTGRALEDAQRLAVVYRPLTVLLAVGATGALLAGLLDPAPWLLALGLVAILSALWFVAVAWLIRAGAWGADRQSP